ncbi:LAMI_0B01442g1_1 [Lachancea mirantina]|uniref:LAMI_0B01442g1_1 n=1 Tax=Lachancea mirantina TaxID=1230905 RepID=A0A1G4ITP8_9SACH|nr:LAMI_0B01442g1_1 [Lachancea mirantina]
MVCSLPGLPRCQPLPSVTSANHNMNGVYGFQIFILVVCQLAEFALAHNASFSVSVKDPSAVIREFEAWQQSSQWNGEFLSNGSDVHLPLTAATSGLVIVDISGAGSSGGGGTAAGPGLTLYVSRDGYASVGTSAWITVGNDGALTLTRNTSSATNGFFVAQGLLKYRTSEWYLYEETGQIGIKAATPASGEAPKTLADPVYLSAVSTQNSLRKRSAHHWNGNANCTEAADPTQRRLNWNATRPLRQEYRDVAIR